MKTIGMIVAVEFEDFKEILGSPIEIIEKGPFKTSIFERIGQRIVVVESGVGETAAAAATQYLIDKFLPVAIVNYGVVGALDDKMKGNLLCLVREVVDFAFDTSEIDGVEVGRHLEFPSPYLETDEILRKIALSVEPSLVEVRCASSDRFIGDASEKKRIAKTFGASICEMEAAGIYLSAKRNGVPALFLKVVADTLYGGAKEYNESSHLATKSCASVLEAIIASI